MKFNEASKDAQVILMGGALAGVIEVFGRDEEDEGKKLIETALSQIGLTFDEFCVLMTDMAPEVEVEVEAILGEHKAVRVADADDDFDDEDLDTAEERPGNLNDDGRTDENGWQNLDEGEDEVCFSCHKEHCECNRVG
ncbi:hypothetical protein MPK70_gp318 [Erwinia phage pEa_SNUABM_33]|uniref:Uncharacterized protein n=1 Tax=Erwinia phage pEa_SNUABM_33 TaxID=2869556 RepID=A0AAE8C068_9CAUD|nr:hypothetical protein MPK70_gp318 [Erwinia phage pEa_SNUABM_33]QZE58194.1 hypothetical protein pEaSNUABM33_00318 [Erwinia phage pEa_SNUABM_33]